ncbi:MAG: DUF4147 domain-containing protein [Labilithrix sp.]|nr:DUF4147 domain-containing protein [Labilithrix sp.]
MRRSLERLFASALADLDPRARVFAALSARPPRLPVRVVAIGKAAPAMASGAIARWGASIEACLVVAPDDTEAARLPKRCVVMRAAHPIPDARSVRAAKACLEIVKSRERAQIVALISGGASSLVCAPAPGVRLGDKQAVTRAMLRSGAEIRDVNVVRKHLSRIKGGGLARAAWPNPLLSLVASDVIDGDAADVGSGPTVVDPSTVAEARRLLERFAPRFARLPLAKTLSTNDREAEGLRARVIASPGDLAEAFARRLRDRGFVVRVLSPSQARADDLARAYVSLAGSLRSRHAIVRAAEPAIAVPAGARAGGRCTHVASLVARGLDEGVVFAAFASDGVDGASGTSGAVVDASVAGDALDDAIARFATGPFHLARGTAMPARPTGHNLADLHVILRVR